MTPLPQTHAWALIGVLLTTLGCSDSGPGPTEADPDAGPVVHGTTTRPLRVDGIDRSYRVVVPATLDLQAAATVVIVLHGNPPIDMEPVSRMSDEAGDRGLVVVYPASAYSGEWVHGCDCTANGLLGVDDVRYFEALLDDLAAALPGGTEGVFVSGFSNGGMMTYRLACDLAHRIDGFGVVAAGMWTWSIERCSPSRPVDLAIFSGTADPQFPWDGMRLLVQSGAEMVQEGIEETVAFWAERNGCAPDAEVLPLPDSADDGTRVEEWRWNECDAALLFFRIEDGGHTWPGSPVAFSPLLGKASRDIDATSRMLDLFMGAQ